MYYYQILKFVNMFSLKLFDGQLNRFDISNIPCDCEVICIDYSILVCRTIFANLLLILLLVHETCKLIFSIKLVDSFFIRSVKIHIHEYQFQSFTLPKEFHKFYFHVLFIVLF